MTWSPAQTGAAGAIAMALAVAAGAFGAHGLKKKLAADLLAIWETAASYHIYHGLGLLLMAALIERSGRPGQLAVWLMLTGLVLFSGSLYTLALTGQRWLGAITPLGGTAWIIAWVLLAVGLWQHGSP